MKPPPNNDDDCQYYIESAPLLFLFQLRNMAGKRQVDGARVGMQHNYGIGGAAVVTVYKKFDDRDNQLAPAKL